MTTITSGNKEFLAVGGFHEVASGFYISDNMLHYNHQGLKKWPIMLPPGNYKIIGLCSEIMKSEQLALQVIEQGTEDNYMRRYDYITDTFAFMTYGASFESFMAKHSLTESTLLIEKI